MEEKDIHQNKKISQNIDFYKIFKVFLSRWYWILGCVIISLAFGYVKIKTTIPVYETFSSIKLQDNSQILNNLSSQNSSQMSSFTDRIMAEGYVIRSNDVILNAVEKLNYKISYYLKGRAITTELYPTIPFKIEIVKQDTTGFNNGRFQVEHINNSKFGIKFEQDKNASMKQYRYGELIDMGNVVFRIMSKIPSAGDYSFKFNTKDEFLGRIASGLNTGEAGRFTNVMNIYMRDGNYTFAADILNEITQEYIKYDILLKQKSAKQTVAFIDEQLGFITRQVDTSGAKLASYKTQNNMVDVNSASNIIVSKLTEAENKKNLLQFEIIGITQLEEQVNNPLNKIEINLNLEGVLTPIQANLIAQFNSLLIDREAKLIEFNPSSPPVKEIDNQLATIRLAIQKNVSALKVRSLNTLKYMNDQIASLHQEIGLMPEKEQKYVKLTSNFQVNNRVQDFLKEKKLEAQMNAAATVASASVVNKAYPNSSSIAIDSTNIYIYAVMMGLAAGVGLILLVRFLNPYIYDKETVESLTRTPIIGVIRKFPEYIDKNNRQALSLSKPKSVFAESVRSVRTNLSFLASHKKSKTICITSEVSGEGKSFVTVNLASTLALIDKKIILIAADLRKSKLHKAFDNNNKIGLSSYLSGQETLENVIMHDTIHGIDFLPSGPVPPNPSELLHTEKMKELLTILTPKYDYVLVDTAPVGLVSDAIPLIRQSDVNLFVIRSGKSQLRAAAIPERLSREYGLSNLAIVLNAFGDDALHANYYTTDYSRGGGNSTYYYSDYSGYAGNGYYEDNPKRWWEFWKKK